MQHRRIPCRTAAGGRDARPGRPGKPTGDLPRAGRHDTERRGACRPDEVAAQLLPLADGRHEIPRAVAQLLHRGWLRADAGDRLYLTDAGEAARMRLRELVTELRAVVHDGIRDEECVVALKVLRRMISNVGGAGNP